MSDNVDHSAPDVVRMANQIADYFAAYPKSEALEGVALHISQFWEARLRKALAEVMDQGGAGLNPLVVEALRPGPAPSA